MTLSRAEDNWDYLLIRHQKQKLKKVFVLDVRLINDLYGNLVNDIYHYE